MARSTLRKDHPLSMRLPDADIAIIDRAASLRGRARTEFMRDAAVRAAIERAKPDAIVNCAGFNAVDAAETQAVAALQANAFAVRSLARAARDTGAILVQFSSDFVFDGLATAPMTEMHPPNPRSAYAASKLLGEWFAADAPVSYVLRVESLFGVGPGGPDKGSLTSIVNGLRAGRVVKVFGDRTVSPTRMTKPRLLISRGS